MIGIYKITNPNGKIYIGQAKDIYKRWKTNYYCLGCKSQTKLYYSLKKYGPENHKFEVVEECLFEQLDEREIYWGLFFNVLDFNKGLNLKLGSGRGNISEETRQKMSKAKLGISRPKEVGLAISKGKMGCVYSEERNYKISKKNTGKTRSKETKIKMSKPILQYDKEGNFIKEWYGLTNASNELKISLRGISNCCLGSTKTSGGYIWRFK